MPARPNRSLETSLALLVKYRVLEYSGELPGVGTVALKLELPAVSTERGRRATVTSLPRSVDPDDIERPVIEAKDELERAIDFEGPIPEPVVG